MIAIFLLLASVSFLVNSIQTETVVEREIPVSAPTQIPSVEEDSFGEEVAEVDDFNFSPRENLDNALNHSATEAVMLVFNRGFSLDADTPPHTRLVLMQPYISQEVYLYFEERYSNIDWDRVREENVSVFADISSSEEVEGGLPGNTVFKVEIFYEGDAKNLIDTKQDKVFLVELMRTVDFHNWTVTKISPVD